MVQRELKFLSAVFVLLLIGGLIWAGIQLHWPAKAKEQIVTVYLEYQAHPTKLVIKRNGKLQQVDRQPPSQYVVNDPQLAEKIFTGVLSLKAAPQGPIACPADYGISYRMIFYEKGKKVLSDDVNGGGCRFLTVQGKGFKTNDSFWQLMQQATGMNARQLWAAPGSF